MPLANNWLLSVTLFFLLIFNLRIGHVFNEVSDLAEFLGQDMGSDCISS